MPDQSNDNASSQTSEGGVIQVSSESQFKQIISQTDESKITVIFFFSRWNTACQHVGEIMKAFSQSKDYRDAVSFLYLDSDQLPDLAKQYNVCVVPYIILLYKGNILTTLERNESLKIRDALDAQLKETLHKNDTLGSSNPSTSFTSSSETSTSEHKPNDSYTTTITSLEDRLKALVNATPVMLFMKGTPSAPQCGFSRQIVSILRERRVRYGFFNILADDEVRQGLKTWADWPTYPQLWIRGELCGGLDIVQEELERNPDFFREFSVKPAVQPSDSS